MGGPAGAREKDTAPSCRMLADIPNISANARGGKANGCAGEVRGENAAAACPLGGGRRRGAGRFVRFGRIVVSAIRPNKCSGPARRAKFK